MHTHLAIVPTKCTVSLLHVPLPCAPSPGGTTVPFTDNQICYKAVKCNFCSSYVVRITAVDLQWVQRQSSRCNYMAELVCVVLCVRLGYWALDLL